MQDYELLLRTTEAATKARTDGFENFAKVLEDISDLLVQQAQSEPMQNAERAVNL